MYCGDWGWAAGLVTPPAISPSTLLCQSSATQPLCHSIHTTPQAAQPTTQTITSTNPPNHSPPFPLFLQQFVLAYASFTATIFATFTIPACLSSVRYWDMISCNPDPSNVSFRGVNSTVGGLLISLGVAGSALRFIWCGDLLLCGVGVFRLSGGGLTGLCFLFF